MVRHRGSGGQVVRARVLHDKLLCDLMLSALYSGMFSLAAEGKRAWTGQARRPRGRLGVAWEVQVEADPALKASSGERDVSGHRGARLVKCRVVSHPASSVP